MVGSGKVPEGVEPSALTDLVQPVAQATSTVPLVTKNQIDMTVEYRNDLNGGLETGFYLSEFGLTDLVQPVAQATSTVPLVTKNQIDMTVEYRNDLNGGLETGFYLSEFGVFARNQAGAEVMIYYACFDDHPQWVQAHTGGAVEVRRFPIAVGVSNTVEVHLDYHADAFMTAENVHEYCITVVLPSRCRSYDLLCLL